MNSILMTPVIYTVEFFFVDMSMMGNPMNVAIGYVMKTAREDLEDDGEYSGALDVCVMGEESPREPKCYSDEDCAPEQECVPSYDNDGKPVPNSEHCETPGRESLDVGPMKIKGFNGGEQIFLYEPGDKVYKLNGEGDGQIDPNLMAYNQEYELYAENPTPPDLNPFSGEFYLGNKLALTSHETMDDGTGFPFIELDMSQPLTFTWTGNEGNGFIEMTVSAAANITSIVSVSCILEDDGEFTLPPELASQLVFGTGMMAQMASMITMTRHTEAPFAGDSISAGKISSEQMIMANIRPKM